MCKEHGFDHVLFVVEIPSVWNDEIDAGHFFITKSNAGVDEDNLIVVLNSRHVAADFTKTSKVDDLETAFFFSGTGVFFLCRFGEDFHTTNYRFHKSAAVVLIESLCL